MWDICNYLYPVWVESWVKSNKDLRSITQAILIRIKKRKLQDVEPYCWGDGSDTQQADMSPHWEPGTFILKETCSGARTFLRVNEQMRRTLFQDFLFYFVDLRSALSFASCFFQAPDCLQSLLPNSFSLAPFFLIASCRSFFSQLWIFACSLFVLFAWFPPALCLHHLFLLGPRTQAPVVPIKFVSFTTTCSFSCASSPCSRVTSQQVPPSQKRPVDQGPVRWWYVPTVDHENVRYDSSVPILQLLWKFLYTSHSNFAASF